MSILKNSSGVPETNLLAIVGPTASGKTALAIETAKKYGGEIICADSRTIYRGLDIGTAKPSIEERQGIPHYGLDLVNPDEKFSASDFKKRAEGWILDIKNRGKLPIIVGGTGLYVDALLYNYSFAPQGSERSTENPRHVNPGVEVSRDNLKPGTVMVGLFPGKEVLEQRIIARAQAMKNSGVKEEANRLGREYGWDTPGASGNIYRVLRPYLEGTDELDEALRKFVILDRQLAKRQMTWFKRNKDIRWLASPEEAAIYLQGLLD